MRGRAAGRWTTVARGAVARPSSSISRRPGSAAAPARVAFLVGLRLLRSRRVPGPPVPAHQLRRRARAARRGGRVLRRCGSDRDLQRQDLRRAGDGDALGVPSHGAAARRRPALRHAASGAAAVEAPADRRRRRRWRLPACRRWSGRCSTCRRVGDVPGCEIPAGSSSSSAAAIRGRSSRCSSTTGSIWCRSRRSRRARVRLARDGRRRAAAIAARRWRSGASTNARGGRRAGRRSAIAGQLMRDDADVQGRGALSARRCAAGASAGSTRRRTSGVTLLALGSSRDAAPSPAADALRQFAAEALAIHHEHRARDSRRLASWRCLRWRRWVTPPAAARARRAAPPAGAARPEDHQESENAHRSSGADRRALRATCRRRPASSSPSPPARPACGSRTSARRTAW